MTAVALAFSLLFVMMAAHATLEAARDAFILGSLSPVALLWTYVIIAVLAVAWARVARGYRRRAPSLTVVLLGGAGVSLAFWAALPSILPAGAIAFYVFTAIYATVLVSRFWLLLTNEFTVREAKLYYPRIGLGGLGGAAVGSALAAWLVTLTSPRDLLALGAGLYAVAAIVARAMKLRPAPPPSARTPVVRQSEPRAYVRRLVGTAILASAALTVVDYLFKSTAAATVPKQELASYFARTYTGVNVLALLVQVGVAPVLLKRLGTHTSATILPALLLMASGSFALVGLPVLALSAKAADGALRNSLHRVTSELFYFPLSNEARERWKATVDALGQRGGQALGASVLLALAAFGGGPRAAAVVAAVLALAWMVVAFSMRGPYLSLFRQGLRRGAVPATVPVLASDTLQAVLEAFSSPDEAVVCAAIDLLAENRQARLVPWVLVHHPSQRVALRALTVIAQSGRSNLAEIVRPLRRHPDGAMRAMALRVRAQSEIEVGALEEALLDSNAEVRSTAMLGLLQLDAQRENARALIDAVIGSDDAEAKVALARAIQADPRPELAGELVQLVETPAISVRREALRAMAAVPDRSYLPILLPLLGDRRLLVEVRRAILGSSFGDSSVVESWLADESLSPAIRRHLPRTLSAFGSDRAAGVLLARLSVERDPAVRYKILRGLGRIRADRPAVPLDEHALHRLADEGLDRAILLLGYRVALNDASLRTPEGLLRALLQSKEKRALEIVFRVLDILQPQLALEDVWRAIHRADARGRDAALELAEAFPPKIRGRLLGALLSADDEERLRSAGGEAPSRDAAITAMTRDESQPVRELAIALRGMADAV